MRCPAEKPAWVVSFPVTPRILEREKGALTVVFLLWFVV